MNLCTRKTEVKTLFQILLCAVVLPARLLAQDETGGAVKVTTRLMPDNTKVVVKTDAGAHTMEATTLDSGDKMKQRIVYALDEQDQPVSGTVYAPNGKAVFKCAYRHDSIGRVTEEADYTLDDQLIRRFVYEYGGGKTASRIRCFDAQGNELSQSGAGASGPGQVRRDEKKRAPFRHN